MNVLVIACVALVGLGAVAAARRPAAAPAAATGPVEPAGGTRRSIGSWLSLPSAPRPTTADDAWVLEAFDAQEIAELRRIDEQVRRDLAEATHAVVLARVPGDRRHRRVRGVGWSAGRLSLVLGDGTSVELDGVALDTAVWLAYCRDQFGLVLEDIGPADTTWSARLASCGVDTPLRASRVRVS